MSASIEAAGTVLWRDGPDGVQVALVHRPRYDDWSLPKGKLADGESAPAAAVREVAEETGFRAVLGRRLPDARYRVPEGPKRVRYWAAEAAAGGFTPGLEVDELRWTSPSDAGRRLDHEGDRGVLAEFLRCPVRLSTLLLVRHGRAGRRSDWAGVDFERPLSSRGRRQAAELVELLPLFGAIRVHSAPPLRCLQTVEPLAARLGVPVVAEPTLSEEGYWVDRHTAKIRLLQIAALPGVAVVCSQGGAIPDLLTALAGVGATPPRSPCRTLPNGGHGSPPSRKGSVWVLSLREGSLLAADYYRNPSD